MCNENMRHKYLCNSLILCILRYTYVYICNMLYMYVYAMYTFIWDAILQEAPKTARFSAFETNLHVIV